MTRLLELNLGSNKLEALPEDIGRMTRLVILNVSDNRLKDLPLSLGMCGGLGRLGSGINLDRNPIKSSDMLKKWKIGTDHLLDYLEKRIASK
jgi:Leucine-rich repeat (LRR) protein